LDLHIYIFFFSSRRRHTRFSRDWSSDVCSSHLGGRSLEQVVVELRTYMLGWKGYFRLADTPRVFHDLDQWIARRLRMVQLKQWKRGTTAYREMRKRDVPDGLARKAAPFVRSCWRVAAHGVKNTAMPNKYLDALGR